MALEQQQINECVVQVTESLNGNGKVSLERIVRGSIFSLLLSGESSSKDLLEITTQVADRLNYARPVRMGSVHTFYSKYRLGVLDTLRHWGIADDSIEFRRSANRKSAQDVPVAQIHDMLQEQDDEPLDTAQHADAIPSGKSSVPDAVTASDALELPEVLEQTEEQVHAEDIDTVVDVSAYLGEDVIDGKEEIAGAICTTLRRLLTDETTIEPLAVARACVMHIEGYEIRTSMGELCDVISRVADRLEVNLNGSSWSTYINLALQRIHGIKKTMTEEVATKPMGTEEAELLSGNMPIAFEQEEQGISKYDLSSIPSYSFVILPDSQIAQRANTIIEMDDSLIQGSLKVAVDTLLPDINIFEPVNLRPGSYEKVVLLAARYKAGCPNLHFVEDKYERPANGVDTEISANDAFDLDFFTETPHEDGIPESSNERNTSDAVDQDEVVQSAFMSELQEEGSIG